MPNPVLPSSAPAVRRPEARRPDQAARGGRRAGKFFWFLTFMYGTLVYCTMFGLMVVAASPNLMIAAVVSAAFFSMWNLFAGFILPRPARARRPRALVGAALGMARTVQGWAWQRHGRRRSGAQRGG